MRKQGLVVLSVGLLLICAAAIATPVKAQDTSELKVMILIADYFGWNYFTARDILLDWGCNLTTVSHSLDYDIPSCLNREQRPIVADLLLTEVDNNTLNQFDALLITSGGQWQFLCGSSRVSDTISSAHDMGILVASICIGNRVMANANNIVNGTRVATYPGSNLQMGQEGAIVMAGTRVVSDNGIITGGGGGGFSPEGGFVTAPTELVCASIVKKALGKSYLERMGVTPVSGLPGTNFTLEVAVDDLKDSFSGILNTSITAVFALVYPEGNRTAVERIAMDYDSMNEVYTGAVTESTLGTYSVDIEIKDENGTLEIIRDADTFVIGTQMNSLLIWGSITIGGVLMVAAIVLLRKK